MNTAWWIGFAVGIMIVAVVCAIVARMARRKGVGAGQYDERQQIARGRAFTWADATLLVYLALWMILRSLEVPFFMESLSVAVGVLFSIAVFVGYSIFHDAYFKASESPRFWIVIICLVGLLNTGLGLRRLLAGATIQERLYENMNLFVGLLLVATLAFIVIKRAMDRRGAED